MGMKRIKVAIFVVLLALTAACSNNEETTSAEKETSHAKETKKEETKPSNENNEDKTDSESEEESTEQEDGTGTDEEYNIIDAFDVTKRNEILYKNEKGSLILVGESLDSDGELVAVVKGTGELKNIGLDTLSMKFITDGGDEYTLDMQDFEGYRVQKDSLIWVFESSSDVTGSKVVRVDYNLDADMYDEDEEHNSKSKTIALKDTTDTETIPALKEIPYYDVHDMNITRENDDYKLNITSMSLDPEESTDVLFRGTIEPKKDVSFGEEFGAMRPALHEKAAIDIELPQNQLYKGVSVDFTLSAHFKTPIGNDKGAIMNFGSETMAFSVNATTGKEYKSNEFKLSDFPELNSSSGLSYPPIKGFTDLKGNLYYNVIESSIPESNWGEGDTSERTTLQYAIGSNYKKLKVKIGAGSALKNSDGNYDFFIYGDDFNIEQDEEPTGTPLVHEKLKSNSPMKEYEVDVSDVNLLTIYYRTNKAPGMVSGDESNLQKFVQVLIADSKLIQ